MKFDCGPTFDERIQVRHERLSHWHRIFVLRPRRLGPRDCRCLEYIERKGVYCHGREHAWWSWEYRDLDDRGRSK